ncbi:hypothetical protein FRB91_009803 [Serendipita sp. 411]|nr:hypothetical protein FRB91_009803 [Serendipita sp. 411]
MQEWKQNATHGNQVYVESAKGMDTLQQNARRHPISAANAEDRIAQTYAPTEVPPSAPHATYPFTPPTAHPAPSTASKSMRKR